MEEATTAVSATAGSASEDEDDDDGDVEAFEGIADLAALDDNGQTNIGDSPSRARGYSGLEGSSSSVGDTAAELSKAEKKMLMSRKVKTRFQTVPPVGENSADSVWPWLRRSVT